MSIAPTAPFAIDEIRARFPALRRTMNGEPVAFLDGPAGAQVPDTVIEAVTTYMREVNVGAEGTFILSVETDRMYDEARQVGADFTGSDAGEIVFGANMTTLNFMLARAMARTLEPGDEIITTELEHEGNVAPWLQVAKDFDLVVRTVPLRPEDASLDMEAYASLVNERTKVVAFTLAANAFGTKTDARRIADLAHEVDAIVWGDAVHFAPHARIDRKALGLDVLVCSPYKFFGPHLGMAVIDTKLAVELPSDRVRPVSPLTPGHLFETGTQSHEALAGFIASVNYLAGLGEGHTLSERLDHAYERITAYEESLSLHAMDRLTQVTGLKVYGITDPERVSERTPTFCFTVAGHHPEAVAQELGDRGIFTWWGNFYAYNASLAYDREEEGGWTRAGFLHYATIDEVDRLCDALADIAARP